MPGPTPSAGVPEEYAALTIAEPPVARIMLLSFISSAVPTRVGRVIMPISPSGPPSFRMASLRTRTVSPMHLIAAGWGEMIRALPALIAISALKIAVEVGLVLGTSPATTPMGTAASHILFSGISLMTPMVFASLMEA